MLMPMFRLLFTLLNHTVKAQKHRIRFGKAARFSIFQVKKFVYEKKILKLYVDQMTQHVIASKYHKHLNQHQTVI